MDKIARLRQEIERRRLHFNKEAEKYQALNNGYSQNCYGARDALRDLENFLDTLSEEPDKSLEEAAEKFAESIWKEMRYELVYDNLIECFIAGAEWQKEQDLAEMAQSKSPLSVAYANRCFENGKQAMKEQMLKDAVEGMVCATITGTNAISFISPLPDELNPGDKVRIVVL